MNVGAQELCVLLARVRLYIASLSFPSHEQQQ
jgi:hypothetical protein